MGIHELSTVKLMPKVTGDRAIPNMVLNGINPLMRIGFETTEDMKDHAQELVDNWDDEACWPGADKLMKQEDVRMLSEFASLPDVSLFFIITMDLRGRMYYRGGLCTPQGNDFLKGAFQFSTRVALGEHGGKHVRITLSNAMGQDKDTLNNRVAFPIMCIPSPFFESFEEMLEGTNGVDNPYQAWAAYQEVIAIDEWLEAGNKEEDFMSNLVCHRDGTCNGIQHMAAITRCQKTAQAVNLCESDWEDLPEDLYKNVLEAALARVSNEHAEYMRSFGRKLTKKAVMVKSYGASDKTAIAGMLEVAPDTSQEIADAVLAAIKVHASSVHKFVNALTSRMNKHIARTLRKDPNANIAIEWHTPDGFRVKIDYRDSELFTIRHHDNEGYSALVGDWKDAPMNAVKTKGALAPNFIHSLDACHLRMVVSACADEEIELVTVHDSIGCHAGNAHTVDRIIREQFVEMHKTSSESLDELCVNMGERKCKWTGKYDIAEALKSSYIFS
jgi:DNA-directed RNA polymerase